MKEFEHSSRGGLIDLLSMSTFASVDADLLVAARMSGVHAVLALLNARTHNRFTGIHAEGESPRFAPRLYDREHPSQGAQDVRDLICLCDEAAASPVASIMRAAILDRGGKRCGTICHFDARLRASTPREQRLLEYVGARASAWIPELAAERGPPPS
jgi:hypothetical protein